MRHFAFCAIFGVTYETHLAAGIAYSLWRLAMGWKVRGWNTPGGKILRVIQTTPEAHPAYCTTSTVSFPR